MMSILIPVKDGKRNYPPHIKAKVQEIPGHFAIEEKLSIKVPYSLHTEDSHSTRTRKKIKTTFSSKIVTDFKHIASAQRNGIPQLWYNVEWAKEFFEFINWLVGSNKPPEVLEIHPPFNDYCKSFVDFLDIFKVFYKKFNDRYPETTVVIENRCGTNYKGGKFLLSKCSDILEFAGILYNNSDIGLKIVLDYPQIFSTIIEEDNKISMGNLEGAVEKIKVFNQELKKHSEVIGGLHMWGKRKNKNGEWNPHAGNFDTFFSNGKELEELDDKEKKKVLKLKHDFLKSVFDTFFDDIPRYFVPEVYLGSQNDLHSIVADMEKEGFIFPCCMLKIIKQKFDDYFGIWNILFPENKLENRESGSIKTTGWEIRFCFGEKDGKEYMDCYCMHRMTNDRHTRIYEDGTVEDLHAFPFGYIYNPNDPEDKKKSEEKYKKEIEKVKKLLCEKGFYPFD